jgi:hypothetical protein
MRFASMLVALLVLCAAPAAVLADDKAAAEVAFLKGKRLMKDGDIAEACDAFAQSQKLDPQIGTQYNLALCYEQQGRIASAWSLFREVAQLDSNAKRKKDSNKRATALEPKLTRLLITTTGATPGLTVTRDGTDVTHLIGVEDPIDPGHYQLVATAPGYVDQTVDVEVHADQGAVVTVKIPTMQEVQPDPVEPDVTEHPKRAVDEEDEPQPVPHHGSPGHGRKLAAIGVGGAGLIAVGVGAVFGAKASSSWSEVEDLCGADHRCAPGADYERGQQLVADTRSAGNLSTILVGAGAVAIAGGVILWVTAPHGGGGDETALRLSPEVGADRASLVLVGGF